MNQAPTGFPSGPRNPMESPWDAKPVTPSDAENLPDGTCVALWVSVTGDVRVMTRSGTDVTIPNVPVGMLVLQCQRVFATNTTATVSHAFY